MTVASAHLFVLTSAAFHVSGFGNYLARPLFREREAELPSMSEADATKLMHDALRVSIVCAQSAHQSLRCQASVGARGFSDARSKPVKRTNLPHDALRGNAHWAQLD